MVDLVPMQVADVVHIMEMELGEGWILNKQCKVAKIYDSLQYLSLPRTSQRTNILIHSEAQSQLLLNQESFPSVFSSLLASNGKLK